MTNSKPPISVLHVEDNASDAHLVRVILEESKEIRFNVIRADRVSKALELLGKNSFDVILTDLKLPDAQGIEVVQTLRARTSALPIVVLTGTYEELSMATKVLRNSAQDFLMKSALNENIIIRSIQFSIERKFFDNAKDEFLNIVSHEIKTPLTVMKESLGLILDGLAGPVGDQQKKFLSIGLNNLERLNRLVHHLLDSSKLEAGKIALNKECVDIVAVVKEVAQSFIKTAREKGLDIRTEFSADSITVFADRDKLVQVFMNLVSNSLKFTHSGGITICATDRENTVECLVKDTGRGIAAEDVPKVFARFQQFGSPASGCQKGTGLGLLITKGLVELHGGTISVESTPGEGTTFIFTLPKEPG